MQYVKRACDCCDADDMEELWSYTRTYRTRNTEYLWSVRNVVCRNCGFAFVSPAPTDSSLGKYYRDSFSISPTQRIDYSIERRLDVIRDCKDDTDAESYLEIGSNDCPEFISEVSKMFQNIKTVELNSDCNSTYDRLDDVPNESADVVASYFVLEHVPKPKEFLLSCAAVLKAGGRLIVEVPNLYSYPRDPAGLFLHEHVNHFSPTSLSHLASRCGLNLIDLSQTNCSRSFGFAAILKKEDVHDNCSPSTQNRIEYIQARSCMREGQQVIQSFHARLEEARELIGRVGRNIVVWGANGICSMLLQDYTLPPSSIVVDSDPKKAGFLSPTKVYQPRDALAQIDDAELLVINTKRHAEDITKWIHDNTGRTFSEETKVVLDYLAT